MKIPINKNPNSNKWDLDFFVIIIRQVLGLKCKLGE
jgi:hypothetical protein